MFVEYQKVFGKTWLPYVKDDQTQSKHDRPNPHGMFRKDGFITTFFTINSREHLVDLYKLLLLIQTLHSLLPYRTNMFEPIFLVFKC